MENYSKRVPKDLIRMRCEMRTARDRLNNASKMIDTVLAICGQMPDSDYREQLVERYLEIAKFDAPEFFKEDTSKSAASELLDKARNNARVAEDKADTPTFDLEKAHRDAFIAIHPSERNEFPRLLADYARGHLGNARVFLETVKSEGSIERFRNLNAEMTQKSKTLSGEIAENFRKVAELINQARSDAVKD